MENSSEYSFASAFVSGQRQAALDRLGAREAHGKGYSREDRDVDGLELLDGSLVLEESRGISTQIPFIPINATTQIIIERSERGSGDG
jgi:hypothetical protein